MGKNVEKSEDTPEKKEYWKNIETAAKEVERRKNWKKSVTWLSVNYSTSAASSSISKNR